MAEDTPSNGRVTNKQLYDAIDTVGKRMDGLAGRQDDLARRVDGIAEGQVKWAAGVETRLLEVKDAANDASHEAVRVATAAALKADALEGQVKLLATPWKIIGAGVKFTVNNWHLIVATTGVVAGTAAGVWISFGLGLPF